MSLWLIFPLIGALTGWLVMSAGLWFLFHPVKPINILGIEIQGIIPKKKPALDSTLSKYIAERFISFEEIEQKLVNPESFQKIVPSIEAHIDDFLKHKLGKSMPMLSMFIGEKTISQLKKVFMEELAELFPAVMKNYLGQLQQEIDVEGVLYAKLAKIPPQRIEADVKELLAQEWKKAKMMGAIIGLVTSLVLCVIHAVMMVG
jgi:uncharacterized membrane protein YheB (UPF0754 family)